jgi:putative membrane protein
MPSDDLGGTRGSDFRPDLRLHSSSWIFTAAGYLKAFVIPLIIATIVGSNRNLSLWIPAVLVVPMIGAALWQQWIYRYGFSPDALVIHEGLIFRNVRKIDYARIENVDTERGLLHRLLDVADVRVETSTGGGAEARIRVLGLDTVEDMRAKIFARRAQHAEVVETVPSDVAAEEEETLLVLGAGEIVRFGLIDSRGMIVVAAALGLLGQGGFFEDMGAWAGPLLAQLPFKDWATFGLLTQMLLGGATAIVLIALTRVLSVVLAFAMLFDFILTRTKTDLHTRYGLLTRISRTLRQPRIQAVHQTETLLHRLFKRTSLRVDLAGGPGAGNDGSQQGSRNSSRELWLAPLCPRDDAERLMRAALPQVRLSGLSWHTLAPRVRWRIFRILSLWWLVLASVPAVWFTGWWAAAILPTALPIFWLHAHLYVAHTGWALHRDFFALKRGWFKRKLAVVRRDRIQSVHLRESPFDRRYGTARLNVDNAGTTASSHRFALSYIDRADAERLAYALYQPQLSNAEELGKTQAHGGQQPRL